MNEDRHRSERELTDGIPDILKSPANPGSISLIVIRPDRDLRELPNSAAITPDAGMVGDRWVKHCTRKLPDGRLNPDTQLTLMNSRVASLVVGPQERWPLAGDNLVVDLDLSLANLPAGQRLRLGNAIIQISAEPHTGCSKFSRRFGSDALHFVNSPEGKNLRLRGLNASVVQAGEIRLGDRIEKC